MPIKLIPPRKGFTQNFYGRGTYLGVFINRSTGTDRKAVALKIIKQWETDIERGRFETKAVRTFTMSASDYLKAGGQRRPVGKLMDYFGHTPITDVDQAAVDAAAIELFPTHSAATRNREVYTPVSAILKHAGIERPLKRPKGSRGRELTGWLWPEQAQALIAAAYKKDAEFGLLCLFLLLTGLRLSEGARHFTCDRLRLSESYAFIPRTKNGEPRPVFLPPDLVAALANHPRGLERGTEPVFRFHKGGRLYDMLEEAATAASVALPERQAFHIFRHTYGTWMRRYGGLDTRGLVGTGAWRSEQSASRYAHTVVSEDAQKAALLPAPKIKLS